MKLLLAEDDPVSASIAQEYLNQWGYSVLLKSNGDDAWEALQQEDAPKLLLLDWKMPGMTGIQLCKRIRESNKGSYIYILLLTGLTDKIHVIEGLEAGADDYISKPFNPNELKVRLQSARRILNLESELLVTLSQLNAVITNQSMLNREEKIIRIGLD